LVGPPDHILEQRPAEAPPVNPLVLEEAAVLRGEDGVDHSLGHVVNPGRLAESAIVELGE
jgi:hypothetical protein